MILIEPYTANDLFAMCGIMNRTPVPYQKEFPFPLKRLSDINELLETRKTFVARNNTDIYGFMVIQTKNQNALFINDIRVDPVKQGIGVGSMMIHKAEEFAVSKSCQFIASEINYKNKKAIHFFQNNGYTIINDRTKEYPFSQLSGRYSLSKAILAKVIL